MTVAMATGRPASSQARAAARGSVEVASVFGSALEGRTSVTGSILSGCYTVAIALTEPQG